MGLSIEKDILGPDVMTENDEKGYEISSLDENLANTDETDSDETVFEDDEMDDDLDSNLDEEFSVDDPEDDLEE